MQVLPDLLSVEQGFLVFAHQIGSRHGTVEWWKRILPQLRILDIIWIFLIGIPRIWIWISWLRCRRIVLVTYLKKVPQTTLEVFRKDPLPTHQFFQLTEFFVPLPQSHKKYPLNMGLSWESKTYSLSFYEIFVIVFAC